MGFPVYTTFVDVTEDLFDKVFAVNLRGPSGYAAWSEPGWRTKAEVR
jgi:hypothetical protein